MDGWNRLGAAFAGGGMQREAAYSRGASESARLQAALLEARKERDAEIGRQAAAKEAFDAGDSELGNAILQGFGTLAGLSTYAGGRQERGFKDEAMGLARAPDTDIGELNQMLMVMSGKPYDPTKIQGNTLLSTIDPEIPPETTELGRAMMGSEAALANQRNASAVASMARASKTRAGSAGAGNPEKATSLTSAELELLLGKPNANGAPVVDPADYRRFLDFQRTRGIPDARRAAMEFGTDFSNVRGGGAELDPAVTDVMQGAKRAPDGNLYIPDPKRPGKWLRVDG
jgi:hypothetical protein